MVNYWHYACDASHSDVTCNALVSQIGSVGDFVMLGEAFDELWNALTIMSFGTVVTRLQSNDDQASWVLNAMAAAEYWF
jgi:hypothetical protein